LGWVWLGQLFGGLGWVWVDEMDPQTTLHTTDRLLELMHNVPLDTKQLILGTIFPDNLMVSTTTPV